VKREKKMLAIKSGNIPSCPMKIGGQISLRSDLI